MIDGKLKAKLVLDTKLVLNAKLGITDNVPIYEGEYVLVPKIKEQVELETKGKKLKENIVMLEIPIYEVGTVITIG